MSIANIRFGLLFSDISPSSVSSESRCQASVACLPCFASIPQGSDSDSDIDLDIGDSELEESSDDDSLFEKAPVTKRPRRGPPPPPPLAAAQQLRQPAFAHHCRSWRRGCATDHHAIPPTILVGPGVERRGIGGTHGVTHRVVGVRGLAIPKLIIRLQDGRSRF